MRMFGVISGFALALALVGFGSALAQEAAVAGDSNGILYASGGIGQESREALRAKEGEYNLMVILVLKDGHYLGGGALTVRDQAGKTLLEFDAQGPWTLAKLPPGRYTVEAKAVTLGPLDEGLRIVREGLKPEDRVIVDGLQRARVGAKVSPHAATAGNKT